MGIVDATSFRSIPVHLPCLPGLVHAQRGHDRPCASPDSSSIDPKIFAALDLHVANVSAELRELHLPAPPMGGAKIVAALNLHVANASGELRELHQQQTNACRAIAENSEFSGKLGSSVWYGHPRDGKHLQPVKEFDQLKNVISNEQFQKYGITV
jgi:hypothetical protein